MSAPSSTGPSPSRALRLAGLLGGAALAAASATCASGTHVPGDTTTVTTIPTTLVDGGDGGPGCAIPADCPAPADGCTLATCNAGTCGTMSAPQGTVLVKDNPPDCKATVCDGTGKSQKGVDPTNVPVSSDPCLVGVCDDMGKPGTAPAAARVACSSGGTLCDGNGNCVACLKDSDCPSGQTCGVLDACMGSHCEDGVTDGDETDQDCGGGTCPACATGRTCKVDADCTSNDCDPTFLVCLGSQCSDGTKDGNETDQDCGGSCSPCALGKACVADQDCSSKACDAVSLVCVTDQCADHRRDGSETDVDCGGSTCSGCALGQKCTQPADCASQSCMSNQCVAANDCQNQTDMGCGGGNGCPTCALGKMCLTDNDCASNACDGVSLVCVTDQCTDHRLDGNESDLDCGGGTCPLCGGGKRCNSSADCASPFHCTTGNPHECL